MFAELLLLKDLIKTTDTTIILNCIAKCSINKILYTIISKLSRFKIKNQYEK